MWSLLGICICSSSKLDVHAQLDKIVYAVLLTRIDWWTELSTPMVISACSRKWFRFFGG